MNFKLFRKLVFITINWLLAKINKYSSSIVGELCCCIVRKSINNGLRMCR